MDTCPKCKCNCELEYIRYLCNDANVYLCPECNALLPISLKYFE